jgi:hypothetical protein
MNSKDKKAQDAYFSDALDWLKAKHGAENLLFAGVHRDETTPHMYAYIVPKVGDRLNARHYFGGAKALNELQTDFAARVGRVHGLERGLEGSKARHTSIKTYYGLVNSETPKLQNPTLPPTKFLESKAEYAIRAKEPLVEFANKYISAINAKNKDLQSKNTLQANELKAFEPLRPLRNALEPYSTSQVNEYVTIKTKDITKASENQVRDAMAKQAARDQQKRLEVQAAAERAAQLRQQQALERAARREVERIAQAKRDKENPSQGVER